MPNSRDFRTRFIEVAQRCRICGVHMTGHNIIALFSSFFIQLLSGTPVSYSSKPAYEK